MTSAFEESVLDFDINFLHPSVNNEGRIDKQRKAIMIVKKKIIATDLLITKYYETREQFAQNEVVLLTAKEECKQVCIDYKEALEKCTQLEKNLLLLKNKNAELDAKCTLSQNQHEGMKSHANQLQLLIKDHESTIEVLKLKNFDSKHNSEDDKKNLSSLQNENEVLLKHLSLLKNIALGKKKLRDRHRAILLKYDHLKNVSSDDDSSSESSCEDPDFFEESPHSPSFNSPEDSTADKTVHNTFKPNKMAICVKNDSTRLNDDNFSDCSNEVVSEDTGRGSSLAFSDGEKCFNSPDYFNTDSPVATDSSKINEKPIASFKSLNKTHDVVHVATSPLIFNDEALLSDNNMLFRDQTDTNNLEYFITDIPLSDEIVTIKEKRKLVDIGTSPVKDIEKVHIATSPLLFEESITPIEKEITNSTSIATDNKIMNGNCLSDINVLISHEKSPYELIDDNPIAVKGKQPTIKNLATHCELEISGKSTEERKCLERNNSTNLCDENSNDCEIEMILNTMRFTQRLITPIPKTPVRNTIENKKQQEHIGHRKCREASILRQENKVLHTGMADLKKDLMDIKCWLKNHLFNQEKSKDHISNVTENSLNAEILGHTTQEPIFIYSNDDNNDPNNSIEDEETGVTTVNVSNSLCNEEATKQESLIHNNLFTDSSEYSIRHAVIDSEKTNNVSENSVVDVPKNDSREALIYEEDVRSEDENDIIINNGVSDNKKDSSIDCNREKLTKHRKLSKLDKFKKKMLPKAKITASAPIRKLRSKSKMLPVTKKNTHMDAIIAILHNKSAYENAAKVMAEIKCKEKNSLSKVLTGKKAKKIFGDKKHELNESKLTVEVNDTHLEQQRRKSLINENAEPVICLPRLIHLPSHLHARRKSNDQEVLNDKHLESIEDDMPLSEFSHITTRSRSHKLSINESPSTIELNTKGKEIQTSEDKRKRLKRIATDNPVIASKRVLRSSSVRESFVDLDNVKEIFSNDNIKMVLDTPLRTPDRKLSNSDNGSQKSSCNVNTVNTPSKFRDSKSNDENQKHITKDPVNDTTHKIGDCRLSSCNDGIGNESDNLNNISNTPNKIEKCKFSIIETEEQNRQAEVIDKNESDGYNIECRQINHPKQSILCKMIEKHGRTDNSSNKKIPENTSNSICKKLEDAIALINDLPAVKVNTSMNKLVDEIRSWNVNHFLAGFIKYLKEPARKRELFKKVNSPPAPQMTKSEQVLLYVVRQMEMRTPNIVNMILTHIEFSLFQLHRTPEFDIIESVSHFYALLCRYFGLKRRLRLFLLDAMYCLRFKVVPLVKQCLDVWMHILPLAHMGIAKSPLVICLVYLLHFYKCEDKFNRIQEIRYILSRKYFYQISDWTETKILDMFKNAIKEVREIAVEKKMLRMALIILGKRQGPKWCQKNIIKDMLMPMIERDDIPLTKKQFCVEMIGALLKPFPADMKVHFEIAVNYLMDMLQQNPPDTMKEAIITSLIYINYHNPNRVIQLLLSWMPKQVSPEFEKLMRCYVRIKTVGSWRKVLSRISM